VSGETGIEEVTGAVHIVVAMKPLDGNFAENAARHGVSGLNIDGCRIGYASQRDEEIAHNNALGPIERFKTTKRIYDGGKQNAGFADTHSSLRRFPTNVVLGHFEGCLRSGVKRVRGNPHLGQKNPELTKQYGGGSFGGGVVRPNSGYADPDGFETVENWECADGCPIGLIGKQSGESGAGFRVERKTGRKDESQYRIKPTPGTIKDFGDTGTAGRYFFQVRVFET